ncbi:hypothetical protein CALCODRAFT_69881 [Calocera cornea HHB12733]|uniref:Pyridoxamine 5'-phosphate oxidase Alr4036 family FMN-binding domain-containing protein n=1 Tax=Calocera cornea HHB12733 TaxID=1353952 RepID=A0A165DIX1_9BASI|nr:hypothetical protein CALCODRAFT_69881 [Calocera cornea HHB12733]
MRCLAVRSGSCRPGIADLDAEGCNTTLLCMRSFVQPTLFARLSAVSRQLSNMSTAPEPAWKTILEKTSKENAGVASTLSTVEGDQPRVRSVIQRSMIMAKPWLPVMITTTDVRTPKVKQITGSSSKVELAWWFPEPVVQFRITGVAHILPNPSHPLATSFPAARLSPSPHFSWEDERYKTYATKMGGALRASFCRPVPGTVIDDYDVGKEWPEKIPPPGEETTDEEREQTKLALNHFALLVIEPSAVEYLELKVVPNRRTKWTLEGEEWRKTILVP